MQMVRQVQDGHHYFGRRRIASTSAPSPRFSSADPASKQEKRSQRRQSFPSRRAFLQGCGERRIAGSAVDEFGRGAERDHHAPGRVADRVLAFGAHLERAFRFRRAIDPAGGGRQKDPLRRLDNRGLSELVHRLPIGPAAAAPLEEPLAILRGIGPGPDQLRKALGRIYARDFRRLPSGRGRRQRRFGERSGSRRRLVGDDGRSRGRLGGGAGAGGEAACCPASGAGAGAGGAVGEGAGGAAASCAAGGAGEGGGEGAALCARRGGSRRAARATGVGPGETGGVTFVWLLAVQKKAAIATRTTPPSKAHNQRDMASPSRRSELSPVLLEVDQTMLMDMSHMNQRRHFYRHVVHQVLMFDVPDMSSPSHVAPSVPATFDINRRSRWNDGLDPMVRAGSCSQVQVRGGMGYGRSGGQSGKHQTHC